MWRRGEGLGVASGGGKETDDSLFFSLLAEARLYGMRRGLWWVHVVRIRSTQELTCRPAASAGFRCLGLSWRS